MEVRSDSSDSQRTETDHVIPCSDFRVYRCHLNRWSFVFSFKCTTKRPHVHVCAEWAGKPLDSMAQVHITHSLMQTKVTVVSNPSLLFSLGQTTNRSSNERERKSKKQQNIHKRKSQILFSSLPGNCLKFFFIKEK